MFHDLSSHNDTSFTRALLTLAADLELLKSYASTRWHLLLLLLLYSSSPSPFQSPTLQTSCTFTSPHLIFLPSGAIFEGEWPQSLPAHHLDSVPSLLSFHHTLDTALISNRHVTQTGAGVNLRPASMPAALRGAARAAFRLRNVGLTGSEGWRGRLGQEPRLESGRRR